MAAPFRKAYILGSSGLAQELAHYLREIFHVGAEQIEFVDKSNIEDYREKKADDPRSATFIGSGNIAVRRRMVKEAVGQIASLKHPKAVISNFTAIGDGTVVAPGAVISSGTKIGECVLVNYNATIGHDCTIGDLSVISPNASVSGWVTIGKASYIGAGAQIKERLEIGEGSVIGMGASVVKDVPPNSVAVGVPARVFTHEEWEERRNG
jgi:UDP-N-acetylbacillosamine N-acetyltransferase